MKKRVISLLALLLVLVMVFTACSEQLPTVNEDGNWEINGTDTGISATGGKGDKGDTGAKGDKGDSVTVTSIDLVESDGLIDTYRITFSDGSKHDFSVTNGKNGTNGTDGAQGAQGEAGKDGVTVVALEKTASEGTHDTWTFKMSDGSNFSFQIANSTKGDKGDQGEQGEKGDKGDKGDTGSKGDQGEKGETGDTGVSVVGIEKTATNGNVATFTVSYSDGSTTTFTMDVNPDDPTVTIKSVSLESATSSYHSFKVTYSDDTDYTFSIKSSADFVESFNNLVASGYEGTEAKFATFVIESLAENLIGSGSVLGAKTFGAALSKIFDELDNYISVTNTRVYLAEELDIKQGFFNGGHQNYSSGKLFYNNTPIELAPGEVLTVTATNPVLGLRFVYGIELDSGSTTKWERLVDSPSPAATKSYTATERVSVVASAFIEAAKSDGIKYQVTSPNFTVNFDPTALTVADVIAMVYGSGNGNSGSSGSTGVGGGYISEGNSNIIVSTVVGQPSIVAKADTLADGESIKVTETGSDNNNNNAKYTIITDNTITFSCDLSSLSDGQCIEIGRTRFPTYDESKKQWKNGAYSTAWLKITKDSVQVIHYYTETNNGIESTGNVYKHNLTIKDYLRVTIESNYDKRDAEIYIATNGGSFTKTVEWEGRQGDVIARTTGVDLENVQLRWYLEALEQDIWLFGDSYFNFYASRWPYYLVQHGYTDNALWGFPGMGAQTAIADFKWAVEEMGYTPHYVVWCMGMNNADSKTAVNSTWLSATEAFLAICEEKGITPILTTTPSTPTQYNELKNEWVRAWAEETGGRYVDFAHAVGGDKYDESLIGKDSNTGSGKKNTTGYQWYDGMLYTDDVHPAATGAEAIYAQLVVDFPEIMRQK